MRKHSILSLLLAYSTIGIHPALFICNTLPAQVIELASANTCRYIGKGRWDWKIFIIASERVLQDIQCVEYTLRPSFPNPRVTICNRGDPNCSFAFGTTGWGTFTIPIKVTLRTGQALYLKHELVFESKPVDAPLRIIGESSSTPAGTGIRDWQLFLHGDPNDLDKILLVQYRLPPLFPNSFQEEVHEIFDRGSGMRGFELSGIGQNEFSIAIRIFYQDGKYQDLVHRIGLETP